MSTDHDHATHWGVDPVPAAAFIAAGTARYRPVLDRIRPELNQ